MLAWAEEGLKVIGDLTGPARDLDVQALEWEDAIAELDEVARQALDPLHHQLLRDREEAHAVLSRAPAVGRPHDEAAPLA